MALAWVGMEMAVLACVVSCPLFGVCRMVRGLDKGLRVGGYL